ncbi:MAG: hypothetical protein OEV40_21240 [Acidimicrobiia bacterium]|nr:hypothetical protein [Acidimicrobiia bacterium]
MRFTKPFWAGIADGSITLAFRRWERPTVVAGRPYRTGGGRVEVVSVDVVDPAEITDAEARRAGHDSAAALRSALSDLPGSAAGSVHRVEFRLLDEPDPREVLANDAALSDTDVTEIDARLDRYDRASSDGPWTRETLRLIADRPATRAPDLAASVGRETKPFKLDVRKLKNLGLTKSLRIGYELSPRGRAYLEWGSGTGDSSR